MLGRMVYGAALFLCIAGTAADVLAGAAPEFYKGNTMRLLVGASAAGAFDAWVRMLGRQLGKQIAGNRTWWR